MKIRFFGFLSVLFLTLLLCCPADAVTREGDYSFIEYADGTAVLQSYNGDEEEVAVPAVLGGCRVTAIAPYAFKQPNKKTNPVRKIILPEGVETIAQFAFTGCRNLCEVVFPASLKRVETYAFMGCRTERLRRISLGPGMEYIDPSAFSDIYAPDSENADPAEKVVDIQIDASSLELRNDAFAFSPKTYAKLHPEWSEGQEDQDFMMLGTSLLKCNLQENEIVIPAGIEAVFDIPETAEIVTFGPDVKYVSASLAHVKRIRGGENITRFDLRSYEMSDILSRTSNVDDEFLIIGHVLLKYNGNAVHVTVPEGVSVIGDKAFIRNKKVESVTLPETVEHIGYWAFTDCTALKEINLPKSLKTITGNPFVNCGGSDGLTVYSGNERFQSFGDLLYDTEEQCVIAGLNASSGQIMIPENTKRIGEDAFRFRKNLEQVTLPEGLRRIEKRAFQESGIREVVLPDSLYLLGEYCFYNCKKLEYADLGRGITGFYTHTPFAECKSLATVIARANVKTLLLYNLDNGGTQMIYGEQNTAAQYYADRENRVSFVAIEDDSLSDEPAQQGQYSGNESTDPADWDWEKTYFTDDGTLLIRCRNGWPGTREISGVVQDSLYLRLYQYYDGFFAILYNADSEELFNQDSSALLIDCALVFSPERADEQTRYFTGTCNGNESIIWFPHEENGYFQNALGRSGTAELVFGFANGEQFRFTLPASDYWKIWDVASDFWYIPTYNNDLYTGDDVNPDLVDFINTLVTVYNETSSQCIQAGGTAFQNFSWAIMNKTQTGYQNLDTLLDQYWRIERTGLVREADATFFMGVKQEFDSVISNNLR